jgi:hypothetical protein
MGETGGPGDTEPRPHRLHHGPQVLGEFVPWSCRLHNWPNPTHLSYSSGHIYSLQYIAQCRCQYRAHLQLTHLTYSLPIWYLQLTHRTYSLHTWPTTLLTSSPTYTFYLQLSHRTDSLQIPTYSFTPDIQLSRLNCSLHNWPTIYPLDLQLTPLIYT